ncbi:hypothetical protein [Kitasatospora setae]|uniref:hypothetical protein n=1 Tax=Kitasatospora setae TaxID=2066 RepID=UPI0005270015|nr:hypothetical protein [Kitasatospora setae]
MTTTSALEPPLLTRLLAAERILVAGAGGGHDVYAGLPLALALRAAGREVHLANLSFTHHYGLDGTAWEAPHLARITPDTRSAETGFPERSLARWLRARQLPDTVWAFASVGVKPLRAAYRTLVRRLGVDAILLVDFGDARFTERTGDSALFINPLMTLYFGTTVEALAAHHLYLDRLEGTTTTREIASAIADFREELPRLRPARAFPH